MSFRIAPLSSQQFQHLFLMDTDQLASRHAIRMLATKKPGFPCRISLADAEVGEQVILLHYEHQTTDSPYKSSHAIYVCPNAIQPHLQINEIPEMFRSRTFSLRGFDQAGMLIIADLAEGTALQQAIETLFENTSVSYIHLHFAKAGCYAARVERSQTGDDELE